MALAADGKTLRGACQPEGAQTRLFCLYDHAHSLVLAQTPVIDGDEIAAFTTALATLPNLHEVVIPADALHAGAKGDRGPVRTRPTAERQGRHCPC